VFAPLLLSSGAAALQPLPGIALLDRQPAWSALPFRLLTSGGASTRSSRQQFALLAYTRARGTAPEFTAVDCAAVLAHVLGDLQLAIEDRAAEVTHNALPTV